MLWETRKGSNSRSVKEAPFWIGRIWSSTLVFRGTCAVRSRCYMGSGTSVSLIFFGQITLCSNKPTGFWAEGNLPNYSAPNNEFRRLLGQIPMLFWYVFFSQRFWFIGKIGNSGLVNHPPIVFLHMNIVELERATSVSQAPPPQHYPWHPPRSKNAAQQFQDEVLSAVSSAQSEIHQKLQDKARAHVRKGTRKTHVVKWLLRSNQMVRKFYAYLIVSQMVQEQVYVMLRFRKFSTHFVICAYEDQQCDSGLSWG